MSQNQAQEERKLSTEEKLPSSLSLSIIDLANACRNTAVSFVPLASDVPEASRHEATKNRYPLGCFRASPMTLVGADAIIAAYDPICRSIIEQNNGSEIDSSFLKMPAPCREDLPVFNEVISLAAACSYNFYHWMLDSVPKAFLAELCGFKGTYIVPAMRVAPFYHQTLGLLGISSDRIRHMEWRAVGVTDLWIPTHFHAVHMSDMPHFHRMFRHRLRAGINSNLVTPIDRIFINRPATASRSIVNSDEVIEALSSLGFRSVEMEKLSLAEQFSLAYNAKFIVGPHGAGMTHTTWMNDGSSVLEIFSKDYENDCFVPHYKLANHRYGTLTFPTEPDGRIVVNVPQLMDSVKRLL